MIYKILNNTKVFKKSLLTKAFYKTSNKKNTYIVIHYTTSLSSKPGTAIGTRNSWERSNTASANYVVDDANVIQCVEDYYSSWHCGGTPNKWQPEGSKWYGKCKNTNSIGIEMCSSNSSGKPYNQCAATDKEWYFTPEVEELTVQLVADLMLKYNIPIENVIMHWDVTGKYCPSPYVRDREKWNQFKQRIVNEINLRKQEEEDENMTVERFKELYNEMKKELQDNDSGAWSANARKWAVDNGLIAGNGTEINGEPNYMWQDMPTREQLVTILYRFNEIIKNNS